MRSQLWVIFIGVWAASPAVAEMLPQHAASDGCPARYQPVCAKKNGHAVGYLNACLARGDGAASIKLGHCSPGD